MINRVAKPLSAIILVMGVGTITAHASKESEDAVPAAIAEQQAEGRAAFSARMYLSCAMRTVEKVDDGTSDVLLVADALRYKCLNDFLILTDDRPDLVRAKMLAALHPTVVEMVRKHRQPTAPGPTKKPSAPPKPPM